MNFVGTRPEPQLSPEAKAMRALFEAELRQRRAKAIRALRVQYLKWLLLGEPRPVVRPIPMFVLQDADAALRAGKLNEAAAQCEKYISAAGGLEQDSSCEMVIRRLAFLYGRLGRPSEAVREYERLAKHYLDMTPPDLKKAHAVQQAARRLQVPEGISPTA